MSDLGAVHTTTLSAPSTRSKLVARPDLAARLSDGLNYPLTLVSAPAGFGKTTLVNAWRAQNVGQVAVAWVALAEEDNDQVRFLAHLLSACMALGPGVGLAAQASLQSPHPASARIVLRALVQDLDQLTRPVVLVLDDYHVIVSDAVHEALVDLLERLGDHVHVTVVTRIDPPLPLARLRARGELAEIRAADLRFNLHETEMLLNEQLGLELSPESLTRLDARTEGWVTGLHLAALTLRDRSAQDRTTFVQAFSGSQRYIVDFLSEEVLAQQPAPVREFLLATAVPERLCGPLCEAMLASEGAADGFGQAQLERLEHQNLFLTALDPERRWFRYHQLFRDVLTRRLETEAPNRVRVLHERASRWFERAGHVDEAVQHALAAGDRGCAARLVAEHGCEVIMRGEVVTLSKWLAALGPVVHEHPWLIIQKAWALAVLGQPEQVDAVLRPADAALAALERTPEVRIMAGTSIAAKAFSAAGLGDATGAADFARQALAVLPDDPGFAQAMRSVAIWVLGDALWLIDDLEHAAGAYRDAARVSGEAGNPSMATIATISLGDVLLAQGRLHRAAQVYAEGLARATRSGGYRTPLADRSLCGLGQVAYAWDHLADAADRAQECLQVSTQWGNCDMQIEAWLLMAFVEGSRGCTEAALDAVRKADHLLASVTLTDRRASERACALMRAWMLCGEFGPASRHVADLRLRPSDAIAAGRERDYLILLRLLLAHNCLADAEVLSASLLDRTEAGMRRGLALEARILRAVTLQAQQDTAAALAVLEPALEAAQAEGYVRLFLNEGEPLARLLAKERARSSDDDGYAARLLAARALPPDGTSIGGRGLVEPLTQREREVLALVETGHSNPVIAARLVIALPTVKRHVSTIYAKLGVASRTQAIARARALNLLV